MPAQPLSNHQCTRFERHSGRLDSLPLIDHILQRMDREALLAPSPPPNGAAWCRCTRSSSSGNPARHFDPETGYERGAMSAMKEGEMDLTEELARYLGHISES